MSPREAITLFDEILNRSRRRIMNEVERDCLLYVARLFARAASTINPLNANAVS